MKKGKLLSFLIVLGASVGLFSCNPASGSSTSSIDLYQPWPGSMGGETDVEKSSTYAFDTLLSITTYHGETAVHDEILSLLQKLNSLFEPYEEPEQGVTSVYSINHAPGQTLTVDPLLFEALQDSEAAYEATDGYFDPLIGNVTSLYKEAFYGEGHTPYLPNQEEVASLLGKARQSKLVLEEGNKVRLEGEGAIDLGGIAKGFALDKTIEILKDNGVCDFLIQFSGSSIGLGNNPAKMDDGGTFRVRINSYVTTNSRTFDARFAGVSTSATYEQQILIGPNRYSHIVNPMTGSAIAENDLGVVIGNIESNAMLDAFSTAVCLIPSGELAELEKRIEDKGYDIGIFAMKEGTDVYLSEDFDVEGSPLS